MQQDAGHQSGAHLLRILTPLQGHTDPRASSPVTGQVHSFNSSFKHLSVVSVEPIVLPWQGLSLLSAAAFRTTGDFGILSAMGRGFCVGRTVSARSAGVR